MANGVHPATTAARHDVILRVLRSQAKPWPIKDIFAELQKVHDRGDWPQATWVGACNHPYIGGLTQMLKSMKRKGLVTEGFQNVAAPHRVLAYLPAPDPVVPLRKRAAEALALQDKGLNGKQIAERMGISNSLAYGLITDPTGEKEKARKRDYCPACGSKKEQSLGWCRKCKTARMEDLLPPRDFMRYVTRAAERGLEVVFGVTPDFVRVIRVRAGRGVFEHHLGSYETWDEGVEAAGLVD